MSDLDPELFGLSRISSGDISSFNLKQEYVPESVPVIISSSTPDDNKVDIEIVIGQ